MTRVASRPGGVRSASPSSSAWLSPSGVPTRAFPALFDALNVVYKEREKRSLVRFYATTVPVHAGDGLLCPCGYPGAVIVLPLALNLVRLGELAERLLPWRAGRRSSWRRGLAWPWSIASARAAGGKMALGELGAARSRPLLWIGVSMLYSWYVATSTATTGSTALLGAGVGFMTWIWLSVVVVLVGAELNAEIERQTAQDSTEGPPSDKPLGTRGARMADTVGEAQS